MTLAGTGFELRPMRCRVDSHHFDAVKLQSNLLTDNSGSQLATYKKEAALCFSEQASLCPTAMSALPRCEAEDVQLWQYRAHEEERPYRSGLHETSRLPRTRMRSQE